MVLGWPLCLDQRGCCIHTAASSCVWRTADSNNQRLHTPHAGKLHGYVAHVARRPSFLGYSRPPVQQITLFAQSMCLKDCGSCVLKQTPLPAKLLRIAMVSPQAARCMPSAQITIPRRRFSTCGSHCSANRKARRLQQPGGCYNGTRVAIVLGSARVLHNAIHSKQQQSAPSYPTCW